MSAEEKDVTMEEEKQEVVSLRLLCLLWRVNLLSNSLHFF